MSGFAAQQAAVRRPWLSRYLGFSYHSAAAFVAVADWCLIVIGSLMCDIVYETIVRHDVGMIDISLGIGGLGGFLFLLPANYFGLYRLPALLTPAKYISQLLLALLAMPLLLTTMLFLLHIGAQVSRLLMFLILLSSMMLIVLSRLYYSRMLRTLIASHALVGRRVVTIGESNELSVLTPARLLIHFGFEEIGRVVVASDPGQGQSYAVDDGVGYAIRLAREAAAEELVVSVGWSNVELLRKLNEGLRTSTLPVRLLPDHFISSLVGERVATTTPMISVELQRAALSSVQRQTKRVLDIALASAALIAFWPVMLMAAIAIRVDSHGPVLFRQQRTGFDGNRFAIYKFRTMTVLEDGANIVQVTQGDRRVTRVGALLRRTSIDELPQLFNVLRGEMSLVGPRPHAVFHDEQYQSLISGYSFRFHVKPGLTGWAQINGLRGETSRLSEMEKRVDCDLWYVNNWSFGLDLWIMVRTVFSVVRHRAY